MEELIQEFMDFSVLTFTKATRESSLEKLQDEIKELPPFYDLEEYIDCIMCLVHSAAKAGYNSHQLKRAFEAKLIKNKLRKWKLNPNNTYSHE